jgi:signal peptidase I
VTITVAQESLRNRGCATCVNKPLKPGLGTVEALEMAFHGGGQAGPLYGLLRGVVLTGASLGLVGSAALASAVVVFHLGVRPVLSGSMRPAYGPGAILITKPVPVEDLHPGMIPLFIPPGEHGEFAHRIISIGGTRENPIITTKGDANKAPDPWHARFKTATVPVVVETQPWVGRLMVGIRGPIQLALIVFGGLMVAVSGTRWILHVQRPLSTVSA